jgi:hypothetical protein
VVRRLLYSVSSSDSVSPLPLLPERPSPRLLPPPDWVPPLPLPDRPELDEPAPAPEPERPPRFPLPPWPPRLLPPPAPLDPPLRPFVSKVS